MKKNLLTLSFLASVFTYAQDTYIGSNAIVKVQPNTLFYNGGNVTLSSATSEVVKNEGNIQIQGNYINNSAPTTKGKEFTNLWTEHSKYGQVIINGNATGKMISQKVSVNSSQVQYYPIGIPFEMPAKEIMNSFDGKSESQFRGNCAVGVPCGQRYWMTMMTWNNDKIVNDAVTTDQTLFPGQYYLINTVVNTGLNTIYNGTNIINYNGVPKPGNISFSNLKTVIPNFSEAVFEAKTYNEWKNEINAYRESYQSYLGNGNDDLKFGKNMFRFGNPYTSNINLSNPSMWMNLDTQTFDVIKLTQGFTHSWNSNTGSSHNSTGADQYITARYSSGSWTGESEAILVRPLEMFRVKFNSDELVTLNVNFSSDLKTFSNTLLNLPAVPGTSPRSENNQFHQLKISLVDENNNIVSEPVFLANSNNFVTGSDILPTSNNTMVLIEEDVDGNIIANAKTNINIFNNVDYIAKPLNLELNNLPVGNSYKLRFNLQENSIFTEHVNELSNGNKFYIHDKLNDIYTEINANTVIDINVNENTKNQYAFYWNETPRTLGTGDLSNKFKTQVYKFAEDNYKIRFDSSKSLANIEIYSVNGTKVSTQNNIQVNNEDYTLKLPSGSNGLFVVKVVYNDGSQNSIKVLVD